MLTVFRIRKKKCLPDPHGQMRIRIHEVKKPRKCTELEEEMEGSFCTTGRYRYRT